MQVEIWQWVAFALAVAAMLAIDAALAGRGGGLRQAVAWSATWLAVGAGFALVVWSWAGQAHAAAYLSGYAIERTLSIDNVFVFALIFGALRLDRATAGRALVFGIGFALLLRVVMIVAGVALLNTFAWIAYLFAGFLIATGARLALRRGGPAERPGWLTAMLERRSWPWLTPVVLAVIAVAVADIVFALDSIPSILAITREPFLVVAANALALVGLRALYDVLAGMAAEFTYLHMGIGLVLVLVGLRMAFEGVVHVPAGVTLAVVVSVIAGAVAASMAVAARRNDGGERCV